MKPKITVLKTVLIAAAGIGTALLLSSWNDHPATFHFAGDYYYSDTVPPKKAKTDREKKTRDLDAELESLEKLDIERELKQALKEVDKAMKELDLSKLQVEFDKAMKEVDWKKIQTEMEQSLAKFDGEKIKAEVEKALGDMNFEKIKAQIKESMAQVDLDKLKTELDMEKLNAGMKNLETELKKIGPEIEKSMQQAKEQIEKAKVELKEYKNFIDGLEKDGLINKKDGYTLKHRDSELFINGKKQPESVYKKYSSILQKHKKFEINNDDDDFNIDLDND